MEAAWTLNTMVYNIEFKPSALKSLKHFPKRDLLRIKKKIIDLSMNPPDLATTKMKGNNSFHKVRIGNYRILYEIHEQRLVVVIIKIGHRKDEYKHLK